MDTLETKELQNLLAKNYDKVCYTVKRQVKQDFDKVCKDNNLVKSKVINMLLQDFVNKLNKGA